MTKTNKITTIEQMRTELRELRDEADCRLAACSCERYDRIIDQLDAQRWALSRWMKRVNNPNSSDGEGLAQIPQVVPDEYMSDGEHVDEMIEILKLMGVE